MPDVGQIVGSVALVVMGIVSHILHDMAIAGDISWQALWRKIFPRSENRPSHNNLFAWFSRAALPLFVSATGFG
jgi:hypothetical protein